MKSSVLDRKAAFCVAQFIQNLSFLWLEIALNQTLLVNLSHQNPVSNTLRGDSFLWHFSSASFCCWSVGARGWGGGWPRGNIAGDIDPILRASDTWKLCTNHPPFPPAMCPAVFLALCSGMLSIKDSISPREKKIKQLGFAFLCC